MIVTFTSQCMVNFQKFQLDNGLRVLIHEDNSTPMVAINILYDVGSRDEDPEHTGFAHLFEHLMFSGSKNVADFDAPMQLAGGENNAFTNSDITNFYDIVPADNIEIPLWLESDRMQGLAFDQKGFDVQKRVVVEEFKETCLNEPYGDAWHKLSALAYKKHPYQWPTIGKIPEHITNSSLGEARQFFDNHYAPNNAIIVLAGQVSAEKGFDLINKWFGDIPSHSIVTRDLPIEPKQQQKNSSAVKGNIPADAIYLGFHNGSRTHPDYYASDILSDILGNGRSSRFYQRLYKEKNIFSRVDSYISGTADPGLFLIDGKLKDQRTVQEGIQAIWEELEDVKKNGVTENELSKVKHKIESSLCFSEVSILNRAISLAFFEWIGDAAMINHQQEKYQAVTTDQIKRIANETFVEENCSELIYERLEQ